MENYLNEHLLRRTCETSSQFVSAGCGNMLHARSILALHGVSCNWIRRPPSANEIITVESQLNKADGSAPLDGGLSIVQGDIRVDRTESLQGLVPTCSRRNQVESKSSVDLHIVTLRDLLLIPTRYL